MNIINRFTLRTLLKNKVRTFVTILGIILATAMFVSITSIITSLQNYMLDIVVEQSGEWQGQIYNIDKKSKEEICDKAADISEKSYVEIYENQGKSKDISFSGIDDNFRAMLTVKLKSGHMPKDNSQIIMTNMARSVYFENSKIGDKIKLKVDGKDREFEISGFSEVVTSNGDTSNDMQIFTKSGLISPKSYTMYFKCKNVSKVEGTFETLMKQLEKAKKADAGSDENEITGYIHSVLLKFYGESQNHTYNKLLYGMAGILMAIIMVASVSLIHNAFSISISERTKQFGLLKSAGATRKQILRSVFFEAGILCIIGIPIGIICGIIGIGITLNLMGNQFAMMFTDSGTSGISLTMHISAAGVLTAVAVTVITVLVSALIPAVKAVRLTVLQALKQNESTGLKRRNVKVNPLLERLFGFEGKLADKNFKRNKRKQRVTVISIAISTALFVAVNSFTSYMSKSLELYDSNTVADLSMEIEKSAVEKSFKTVENALKGFKGVDNIDDGGYSVYDNVIAEINIKDVDSEYLNGLKKMNPEMIDEKKGIIRIDSHIWYLEDDIYNEYIKKNNIKNTNALAWPHLSIYNENEKKNYSYDIIKLDAAIKIYQAKEKKGYELGNVDSYKKLSQYYFEIPDDDGESAEGKVYSGKEAFVSQNVSVVRCNKKLPLCIGDESDNNVLTIVKPYSEIRNMPKGVVKNNYYTFAFKAKKHSEAKVNLKAFINKKMSGELKNYIPYIADYTHDKETSNAMVMIVNVFSYGFIVLISLIVIANVFNTISTNILLRRQEFAMLKSVGMTKKSLNKMMNYECVFYGIKGLIFGIIMAVIATYAMFNVMSDGFNVGFYIPVQSIVVVVISIFIVVFASMIYTMKKIKKDNVIETLRNDNI